MESSDVNSNISTAAFLRLRHDIKNQLSNIQLAIAGLKFECQGDTSEDLALYISSLEQSAKAIDLMLNDFTKP